MAAHHRPPGLKRRATDADVPDVDLPLDLNTHAHLFRDAAVLVGVFFVVIWLLFRFASR
jgi:hypothetical protein